MDAKLLGALIFLGVILVPMAFGTNIINLLQGRQFSTVGGVACQDKVAEPLMGFVECAQLPEETTYHEDWEHTIDGYYEQQFTIRDTCGIDENTPSCTYTFLSGDSGGSYIEYRLCDQGSCGDWRRKSSSFFSNQRIDIATVESGDGVVVRAGRTGILPPSEHDWQLREDFTPYGLKSYEPTWGQEWISKSTCDFDYINKEKLPEDYDDSKISENMLMYGESLNYRVSWNTLDYDLAIDNHPDYGDVWCGGRRLYDLSKFDTASGDCYWTVGEFIKSAEKGSNFECCPGEKTQTEICNSDFQLTEEEGGECVMTLDCPGGGDWIVDEDDTDRKTVEKYTCDNGYCEVVDTDTVECTYNGQCGEGYLCEDYECVQGEGELEPCDNVADGYCPPGCINDPDCQQDCGNGVCEEGETEQNCPSDCGEETIWDKIMDIFGNIGFWGKLILSGLGGLLGFLSISKITSRVSKNELISLGIPLAVALVMVILPWTGFWAYALALTAVWFAVEWVV